MPTQIPRIRQIATAVLALLAVQEAFAYRSCDASQRLHRQILSRAGEAAPRPRPFAPRDMMLRLRGGGEATEKESEEAMKYDRVLWDMLQAHPDEIHFLNTIFNFLQRRTSCFSGPRAEDNYQILIETLSAQRDRYLQWKAQGKAAAAPVPLPDKKPPPTPITRAPPPSRRGPAREAVTGTVLEDVEWEVRLRQSPAPAPGDSAEVRLMRAAGQEPGEKAAQRKGKGGKKAEEQAPVDNGGTTERYTWTQTLREVVVEVLLPEGTSAKMLDVKIGPRTLDARIKGAEVALVDGEWDDEIYADECTWHLEDGYLVLTVTKKGDMVWWKRVLKGDAAIDIKQIQPETSNMDDLAPDLRQTVEKMMHDQRQKAQGLPTSQEREQKERLKKFMEMHPEMDFSRVTGQMGGGAPVPFG